MGIGIVAATSGASASASQIDPANFAAPFPLCGQLSTQCIQTDLSDINAARASEGVGAMILPANFASLSPALEQLVVTNSERSGRGLSTFAGLDPALNAVAQSGADAGTDPTTPASYPWDSTGSIWAGASSALESDYLWMYDDGTGGTNLACSATNTTSCDGHRDNILRDWSQSAGDVPAMGAATSASGTSWAQVFASNTAGGPTTLVTASLHTAAASTTSGSYSGISATGDSGYYVVSSAGKVSAFGSATFHGDLTGVALNAPIISITATADGQGYWLLASDGGVFSFGDAKFYGSTGALSLNAPVVGMATTPDGGGYWIIAQDGGVFAFGDATFHGSTGAVKLNEPVDGIAVGPGGNGYWLVASDGGVFSFGEPFVGSLGATSLNEPIIGMSSDSAGNGYTLVGSDGGVFNFNTPFFGSLGATPPSTPVAALSTTPDGGGYLLVDQAGDVFTFGDAVNLGGA